MMNSYHLRELKIEITRRCPLECLHCSSDGMPHAVEMLSVGRVCDLVREFARMGGQRLCISGGEPLCYEGLPAIIDVCHRTGMETVLYTTGISSVNGSLQSISDWMLTLLAGKGVSVIFSLHGARARTHDLLTQVEGSFETTMAALVRAVNAGLRSEVHVVPMAINLQELPAISELTASMNVKRVSWLRFVPQGRGAVNREVLQLSKDQFGQLARTRTKLKQMHESMRIRTGAPFNVLCPPFAESCDAGLSVLTIGPDGRTAPCDAFKRFRTEDGFGNILCQSLSEVWEKSYILNEVRTIHENRAASSCASCPLYARCNSGCLAQKAIALGRLTDGRDPECVLSGAERCRGKIEAASVC